jgi:hypothetical protein
MLRSVVTATLALLVLAAAATPVTLVRMDLRELAGHADVVFVGTVDRQVCEKDPGRRGLIVTRVTFKDLTVLAGTVKTPTLTLTFTGGEIGRERVVVPGMPRFSDGDRVLLFAGVDRPWHCPVIGWHQGRFDLVTDPETDRPVVLDGRGRRVGGIVNDRVVLRPGGRDDYGEKELLDDVRSILVRARPDPEDGDATGEDER